MLSVVTHSDVRTSTKVHLPVVHCWDMEFSFPLTVVKGSNPAGLAVNGNDGDIRGSPSSFKNKASIDQLALI